MLVSNTLLIVAAEIFVALLAGVLVLFFYARKLKSLTTRQQAKLLQLLEERKNAVQSLPVTAESAPAPIIPPAPPAPAPAIAPSAQNYKDYRHKMITATTTKYSLVATEGNIEAPQEQNAPLLQRLLALRHAFLQAEELAELEIAGTDKYWNIFEQILGPLLSLPAADSPSAIMQLQHELDNSKKQIEALENTRYSWLDLQQQAANLHSSAQEYHRQLLTLTSELGDREEVSRILQQYQEIFDDIYNKITNIAGNSSEATDIDALFLELNGANETDIPIDIDADDDQILNSLPDSWMNEDAAQEREEQGQEQEQEQEFAMSIIQEHLEESANYEQLLESELLEGDDKAMVKDEASQDLTFMLTDIDFPLEMEEVQTEAAELSLPPAEADNLAEFELPEAEEKPMQASGEDQKTDNLSLEPSFDEAVELQKIQNAYSDLQKQYSELQEKYLGLKTAE